MCDVRYWWMHCCFYLSLWWKIILFREQKCRTNIFVSRLEIFEAKTTYLFSIQPFWFTYVNPEFIKYWKCLTLSFPSIFRHFSSFLFPRSSLFFLAQLLSRAAEDNFSHCLFLFSATLHGRLVLFSSTFSLFLTLLCSLAYPLHQAHFFPSPFPFSTTPSISELIGGSPLSPMSMAGLPSWHGSAVVVYELPMAQTLNVASCSSQQHLSFWNVAKWGVSRREGGGRDGGEMQHRDSPGCCWQGLRVWWGGLERDSCWLQTFF